MATRKFEVHLDGMYNVVHADTPEQAVLDTIEAEIGAVDYNVTHSFRIKELYE